MIQFTCPGCPAVYTVDDAKAGKSGKCPKCDAAFVIPHPDPQPPNADSPVEVAPCPGCQARLSVAPTDIGTEVECPYCQAVFRAKRADTPPAPARRDDDAGYDEYDDDYDDRPRRRRAKPGAVGAVGGMLLAGGIYALLHALGSVLVMHLCCVWPGVYFALVWGVLAIIRGSAMVRPHDLHGAPRVLVILQIILIVNFDVVNCVLGIIGLVLLNNPEARAYYDRIGED